MSRPLRVRRGGSGRLLLLLLHGLGATGDVFHGWSDRLAVRWPGRWLAPDLPGHGGSAPLPAYSFESLAAAVGALLRDEGATDEPVVVLGHSLGGVVGLALSDHGVATRAVVGLGIKVAWSPEDVERARALAGREPAWFATRGEAAIRYLRVAGLTGLVAPDDPAVGPGLREEDGRWRLAMDPAAFGVGVPDMPALLARSPATVVLARGEHDAMVSDAQLTDLGATTVSLPGLGHNAHVEDPDAVLDLLQPYR